MKLVYFGLPLGALLLQADGHVLELAVLSPVPAPGKRRLLRRLGPERVLSASELGAHLDPLVQQRLGGLTPELLVSWFWTRRLPSAWLERAKHGAIGVHPSLLPRHRGPNPYFGAIDCGDPITGVSVHRLTCAYDEGDVLLQLELPVGTRNAWQLARALDRPSLAALRATVARFAKGESPLGQPQDEAQATWAPEPSGAALGFDPAWSRERALRRIRALSPVPGLTLDVEGLEVNVLDAKLSSLRLAALEPGQAAVWGSPPALYLAVGDGVLELSRATLGDDPRPLSGAALARRVSAFLQRLLAARS